MSKNFDACKGPNGIGIKRRWENFKYKVGSTVEDIKSGIKTAVDKIVPDKEVKMAEEPIWVKAENVDPKIEPKIDSIFTPTKGTIRNQYGSKKDLKYSELEYDEIENKLVIKQNLDVNGSHLPGALSATALLMNGHDDSSLLLAEKAQDFGIGFDIANAYKSEGSEDTISEEEFMLFLESYAIDANSDREAGDEARNRLVVHFDEKNQKELQKAFRAIAGEDNLITKDEFEKFWNNLITNGEKIIDSKTGVEYTKITGKDINNAINQGLEEMGEIPSFRKTTEEISYLEKEKALQELRVNVDPSLVEKIEYSENNKIAFITLDDGTELQFSKESHYSVNTKKASSGYIPGNLSITKEDDRYVVTNILANDVRGERNLKIIPNENTKITLRDGSNVIYSSSNELNDDIIVEGDVKQMKLIVGTGDDKLINNQTGNSSEVKIIKDILNESIVIDDKNDIVYTHVENLKKSNYYYSARSTDIKKLQKKDLEKYIDNLETVSDEELLMAVLQNKTDQDLAQLSSQELLQLAVENGIKLAEDKDELVFTSKERKKIINDYKKEQIDYFKEINKTARKEEKEVK